MTSPNLHFFSNSSHDLQFMEFLKYYLYRTACYIDKLVNLVSVRSQQSLIEQFDLIDINCMIQYRYITAH